MFLEATGGDAAFTFSAQETRTLVDALVIGTGVSFPTDLAVAQRAAGANFSVDVAAGHCIILGSSVADQGKYVCQNTSTFNLTITGAPASGTRFDLVYAQVRDKQADGGSAYDWVIDKVTGTVGAGLPATPANAIPLAQIGPIVTATASITTALITSLRTSPNPVGGFYPRRVSRIRRTIAQAAVTAETALTGMSITPSVIASRIYVVEFRVPALISVTGIARVFLRDGAGTQIGTATDSLSAGAGLTLESRIDYVPATSGAVTLALSMSVISGGGNVTPSFDPNEPGHLYLWDMGT